jgi:phosphomannomutase
LSFSEIFKAYDVRGIYPDTINEDMAYKIGRATAVFLKLKGKTFVIGRDMRNSSKPIFEKLSQGFMDEGVNVVDVGLVSTDGLYFAVGNYRYAGGIMITASHNPKEYNGMKFCREDAIPLSLDQGLAEIRDIAKENKFSDAKEKGNLEEKDVMDDYVKKILSFIDINKIKPLKIVVDAGNGMAGKTFPEVAKHLPCEIIEMFFELDGTFPNHLANPILPENVELLQKKVLEEKADFGMIFDGDADRVYLVDEKGVIISGTEMTAMISEKILLKNKGDNIIYNASCGWVVPETVEKYGGKPVMERGGHSYIKATMRKVNAAFGGEHSGHYFFRDFYYADSGIIAGMIALEMICQEEKELSEIILPFRKYPASGEINSVVEDKQGKMDEIKELYKNEKITTIDGVRVDTKDFWFVVRPSNTEPLLRLNVEAKTCKAS